MSLRFKRFHGQPAAVFVEMEGCLLDHGCMVTVNAIQALFAEKGVTISDVEAAAKQDRLVGTDLTCKKTQLRHVLMNVCKDKWEAATGSAPTEWDLEALFKDFPRVVLDQLKGTKPVSGAVDAVRALQAKGMKVAITSNFSAEAKDAWARTAHHYGFEVDASMACAEVPNPGREEAFTCVLPEPWRCMALAAQMGIYPMSTTIRVSTTQFGIEEGLNAGMWTVALSTTGLVSPFIHGGESEPQRQKRVAEGFYASGCHYVVDGIWELPRVVADIEVRMSRGECP
jgi:phosphonoacetaldehyde hydrolase